MPLSFVFFSSSIFVLFFWRSLTFAWIALSGFQSTGNIFLYAPNFCLDCPFEFSIHRDAHFRLKPPFRVFDLANFFLSFFLFFFDRGLLTTFGHTYLAEFNCPWNGCWCMFLLLISSKKMYRLFMHFKRHEKVLKEFFFDFFFALSINIKNRRNFVNRINENFK